MTERFLPEYPDFQQMTTLWHACILFVAMTPERTRCVSPAAMVF
jgi:hypothetical protein